MGITKAFAGILMILPGWSHIVCIWNHRFMYIDIVKYWWNITCPDKNISINLSFCL